MSVDLRYRGLTRQSVIGCLFTEVLNIIELKIMLYQLESQMEFLIFYINKSL